MNTLSGRLQKGKISPIQRNGDLRFAGSHRRNRAVGSAWNAAPPVRRQSVCRLQPGPLSINTAIVDSALATKATSKCRRGLPSRAAWDKLAPMINHQAVN